MKSQGDDHSEVVLEVKPHLQVVSGVQSQGRDYSHYQVVLGVESQRVLRNSEVVE